MLRMPRGEAAPTVKLELAPKPVRNPVAKPVTKPVQGSALNAGQHRERLDRENREKAALDIENEALRSKIAILEGKVAVLLQDRVARLVLAAPQEMAAPVVAPVKSRSTFWVVGAAALAALLLAAVLVYRKKIIGSRRWVALRKRLRRKAVEPVSAVPDESDLPGPDGDKVAD